MDWKCYWKALGVVVAVAVLAEWLSGCAPDRTPEPGITRACVRSFAPTLAEWEARHGRVPDECAYLDSEVDVVLASKDEIPCPVEAPLELVIGCYQGSDGEDVIYLLEMSDNGLLVDTSVHEWVHALADCVLAYPDIRHLRGDLWAQYGADTVELQAQAAAEIGECL